MHSSRMRTAGVLPVSPGMHCSRGCTCLGEGFPAQGRWVPARGVYMVWVGDVPGPRRLGVYLVLGVGGCTWSRGCTWSQRGVPVPGGVPGPRGCTSPSCGQNDRHVCKHNFRKLRLRAVIIQLNIRIWEL